MSNRVVRIAYIDQKKKGNKIINGNMFAFVEEKKKAHIYYVYYDYVYYESEMPPDDNKRLTLYSDSLL